MSEQYAADERVHNLKLKLVEKLELINKAENQVDLELKDFEAKGVTGAKAEELMKALHDYNAIKDSVAIVFEYLSQLKGTTCAQLYADYNIPLE